jgi:hypothetical protein
MKDVLAKVISNFDRDFESDVMVSVLDSTIQIHARQELPHDVISAAVSGYKEGILSAEDVGEDLSQQLDATPETEGVQEIIDLTNTVLNHE